MISRGKRRPSHTKTFSTGYERWKIRSYWDLWKHYRDDRQAAIRQYGWFCEAYAALQQSGLTPVEESAILEIGSGQRFAMTLLFHSMGARAIGVDMDYVEPNPSLRSFVLTLRHNGIERAVKSAIRHSLFDRAYYRQLERAFGRPLNIESVKLSVMDARALTFADNSFDYVCSSNVFEHIDDVEAATKEAARVLKPDGIAFIRVHLFPSLSGGHHFEWSRPEVSPSKTVPPWDHLRQKLFPSQAYLNKLREKDYLVIFARHFSFVRVNSEYQGEQFLTDGIERELCEYGRDELLKHRLIVVMRKAS